MNAYYEYDRIHSDRRAQINIPATHIGDRFISLLCAIVAFFTSSVAIKIEKTGFSAVCFIGFFGVIGSMESAAISPALGILLCFVFGSIEFFTLKSIFAKKKH